MTGDTTAPRSVERPEAQLCRATFEFYAPSAGQAFLVGEFNDWRANATPMRRCGDGTWRVELLLPPGFYRHKFVVDSVWRCSPDRPRNHCEHPCQRCPQCVPNPYGSFDRVAIVA